MELPTFIRDSVSLIIVVSIKAPVGDPVDVCSRVMYTFSVYYLRHLTECCGLAHWVDGRLRWRRRQLPGPYDNAEMPVHWTRKRDCHRPLSLVTNM